MMHVECPFASYIDFIVMLLIFLFLKRCICVVCVSLD